MDCSRLPSGQEGAAAMRSPTCLSVEEQRQVCEDLLFIIQAKRLDELAAVRLRMLRESRGRYSPSAPWVQLEIDRIAKTASRLVCGSAEEWLDAAAAALDRPSQVDTCIRAIRHVAEQVRADMNPQQPFALPVEVRVAKRKRGGR
jgi:hypothetical protein